MENLIALIVGALAAFILTLSINNELWKDDLVKKKHAEYYLDEKNQKRWRLIETSK